MRRDERADRAPQTERPTECVRSGSGGEARSSTCPRATSRTACTHAAPNLLPGEVRAHPDPFQYVIVAVVLVGDHRGRDRGLLPRGRHPRRPHRRAAAGDGSVKFVLVASWFMHLRTDKPVFRRFFILGAIAALVLYPSCWRRCTACSPAERRSMPLAVAFPAWTPHPDVWLLVGLFAAGYAIAIVRLGPGARAAGQAGRHPLPGHVLVARRVRHVAGRPTGRSTTSPSGTTSASTWCSTSCSRWWWRRSCCSGPRPGCCAGSCGRRWLFRTVRALCALHPRAGDLQRRAGRSRTGRWSSTRACTPGSVHFCVHALLLVSSLIVWMPIVSPLPEIPRLAAGAADALPVRAGRSCRRSRRRSSPSARTPLYKFYEHVPHLWGLSTLEDQQIAGLIMKIGGRTPTLDDHRRSVLPLGRRGGAREHSAARTRRAGP